MLKSIVKIQHYDVKPGTVVFKIKISESDSRTYGIPYWVVTTEEGVTDPAAGTLRTIPEYNET